MLFIALWCWVLLINKLSVPIGRIILRNPRLTTNVLVLCGIVGVVASILVFSLAALKLADSARLWLCFPQLNKKRLIKLMFKNKMF
jgi:hypothetical protein